MMSLQSATHSSQMNTRGPEISLRTSRRRFPQKEQWKSSIRERVLHLDRETPSACPAFPNSGQSWVADAGSGSTDSVSVFSKHVLDFFRALPGLGAPDTV